MKTRFLAAALGGALMVSAAATAQAQQQGNILEQLLGSVFGTSQQASDQTLDSDWNQGRRPFEQRRDVLDARIDAAVRDGSLGRGEADQMRREYNDIVRLEAQYSADGNVSEQQRADLRMRYRALSQRVGGQGSGQGYGNPGDGQGYGNQGDGRWQPLSMRNAEFEQRVNAALRNRSLTQYDASRLRSDWQGLARLEASYQRGGIDAREQADLWARFNAIDNRLGGGFGNDRNTARWSQLESRLAAAERNGSINRNDAAQLRVQLADLSRLDAAYAMAGYNADERSYLTRRYGDIDTRIGYGRR
jgi:opacity protein-like surface antigen